MTGGPDCPTVRQLIDAELLLGVPGDVAEKATANPDTTVATLMKREQGTQTERLPKQQGVAPRKKRGELKKKKSKEGGDDNRSISLMIGGCGEFSR